MDWQPENIMKNKVVSFTGFEIKQLTIGVRGIIICLETENIVITTQRYLTLADIGQHNVTLH